MDLKVTKVLLEKQHLDLPDPPVILGHRANADHQA